MDRVSCGYKKSRDNFDDNMVLVQLKIMLTVDEGPSNGCYRLSKTFKIVVCGYYICDLIVKQLIRSCSPKIIRGDGNDDEAAARVAYEELRIGFESDVAVIVRCSTRLL